MSNIHYQEPVIQATASIAMLKGTSCVVLNHIAYLADPTVSNQRAAVKGILAEDVPINATALVQILGPISLDSWTWTPNAPVYYMIDGGLSQSPPPSGWRQIAGIAVTSIKIVVEPSPTKEEDKNYVHLQNSPSAIWNIVHNLGKRPSVTAVDSLQRKVIGGVVYDSDEQLTLDFSVPFSGIAYLN